MMKFFTIFILSIIVLISCKKEESLSKQLIVVDGSIEEGGYPLVYLTGTTQFESVIDSSVYFDVILTHAKITVRTEDKSDVLILRMNNKHFPNHYYVGNTIKGEAGKTYYLEVILDGDTITSKTTIPAKIELQSLRFEKDATDTTVGFIWVGFNDPEAEQNYYRGFTKIYNIQTKYIATHLSVLDDASFNGKYVEFPLYQGFVSNTDKKIDYRYSVGDTIDINFCTIDKESFDFWSGYERELINAGNPFGAEGRNLVSNIKGGIGVWTGYSVSKYRVIAK